MPDLALPAVVGLLPVATFLATLLYLDSYKLVKLRTVIAVVACGAVVAGASYLANAACSTFCTSTSRATRATSRRSSRSS